MSNCYAGKDGALGVSTDDGSNFTNIAMLTSWTVTQNAELLECNYMGATWKESKSGLLGWEGSAEANFTDTAGVAGRQSINQDGAPNATLGVGSKVRLYFYPKASDTDFGFTGDAIITSIENSATLGEVQTVSISFTGTGALTTDVSV